MSVLSRNLRRRCVRYMALAYMMIAAYMMVVWLPAVSRMDERTNIQITYQNETETTVKQVDERPVTRTVWSSKDSDQKYVFEGTFRENLEKLKRLEFTESEYLMDTLGFNQKPAQTINTSLPVLVTGADSKFFKNVQGVVKTVHEMLLPKYPDLKFIMYDMGFTDAQHNQAVKYCKCEVRKLPFKELPAHVKNLGNFAFKPIILNYLFQEFGRVWWVDASVRFISNDLEKPMEYLETNGALFFTYGPVLNIALHTHRNTFKKFEENPLPYMYFGEVEAGNVAFVNNDVGRVILNRWVSCALDASCLTPNGAKKACRSPKQMTEKDIASCHRYDQSALSIILRRLYHEQNDYPLTETPFRIIQVKRGHQVNYFPAE